MREQRQGVPRGRQEGTWVTLECATCGQAFERPRAWTKGRAKHYCSRECNGAARGAEWAEHGHKGRASWRPESEAALRERMTGETNPSWKGGVMARPGKGNYGGARYVRAPEWARGMSRKDGYVMEHRLVMAQRCGFVLRRAEAVHHLDHDSRNNKAGNLELWPTNTDHKLGEVGRFRDGAHNRYPGRDPSIPFPTLD